MSDLLEITERERLSREDAAARLHAIATPSLGTMTSNSTAAVCTSRCTFRTRWTSSSRSSLRTTSASSRSNSNGDVEAVLLACSLKPAAKLSEVRGMT